MRGRTNITQRALPYVNGDVITAEVETGNTISIGDFVEYKTVSQIEDAGFTWDDSLYKTQMSYGTDYILALTDYAIHIWSRVTNNLIYSLVFNNGVFNCNVLEDGVIVALGYSDNSTQNLYYIIFENNTLIIKDTKTINFINDVDSSIPSGGYAYIHNLVEVDNSHIAIFTFAYKATSPTAYNKSFVSIVELDKINELIGQIENTQEIDFSYNNYPFSPISNSNPSNYRFNYCSSKIKNENKILISYNIPDSSTASYYNIYTIACYLTFDNNYNFIVENKMRVNQITISSSSSFAPIIKGIKVNDKLLAFYSNAGSSSSMASGYVQFCKYDNANDDIIILGTNSFTVYRDRELRFCIGKENEVFVTTYDSRMSNYILHIHRFELPSDNVIVYTEKEGRGFPFMISILPFSSNDKIIGYNLYSSENKKVTLKYNSQDNEFEDWVDTNYVKSYNGGKAIGFAKTAGNSGESIKVYVPHQS